MESLTSILHLQSWNWRVSTVSPDWARKRTSAIGRPVAEWKIHPNSSSPPLTLNQKRCRDTKGPETRLFHRRHCGHGFSTAASNGAKLKKIEEFVSPQMFCSDFIPGHIWVVRLHPMVWNILNHCNLDALRNRLSTLALSKRSDSCWAISWVAVAAVHECPTWRITGRYQGIVPGTNSLHVVSFPSGIHLLRRWQQCPKSGRTAVWHCQEDNLYRKKLIVSLIFCHFYFWLLNFSHKISSSPGANLCSL